MPHTDHPLVDCYNYHDLLKLKIVRTRRSLFDIYLNRILSHYKVDSVDSPDLCIQIGPFTPDLDGCYEVDGRYHIKKDYIYYKNTYKLARWGVEIRGLEAEQTQVRITGNAFGRIVFPGETIYSLIRYKLAQKGYPLIHGSGVGTQNQGYIFSARGGTGKTITAVQLVKKGFFYYSDDSVILGNNTIYSFIAPFNLRFKYDVQKLLGIHFSAALRFDIAWKRLLYYLSLKRISLFSNIHARDLFRDSIKDKTHLSRVFVLTQGPEFRTNEALTHQEASTRLFINIWFESPELIALLLAYTFVFPDSPLSHFWTDLHQTIADHIHHAGVCEITMPALYSQDIFDRFYKTCFSA